jgi:ribosomal protein S18 acetylase RimI-like enzyme
MRSQPTRALQVRPTDPLVRWIVTDEEPPDLVAQDDAVAWMGRASRPGENWVTALGDDPAVVVTLVERLESRNRVDGITVPESAFSHLPERLRSPDPGHWCLWTLDPADAVLSDTTAIDLALDDPRIGPLLAHSDSAHIFPGNPRLVRWSGVLDGDRLVSVAAQVTEASGAAHIVSVCTDPGYRGRGLARDACMRIMSAAVGEGAPMLVLEMYTANEAGRRAYGALGFAEVGRYASGLLHPEGVPAGPDMATELT